MVRLVVSLEAAASWRSGCPNRYAVGRRWCLEIEEQSGCLYILKRWCSCQRENAAVNGDWGVRSSAFVSGLVCTTDLLGQRQETFTQPAQDTSAATELSASKE